MTALLTTGWDPQTPVGDTMLRRFVFNLADSWAAPAAAQGGRVMRETAFVAADIGIPGAYWNSATLLQPLPAKPAEAAATLARIESFFTPAAGDVLLWSAWPTPDLRDRGWRLEGHPPFLLRMPGPLPPAPAPSALRVDRVTDARGVRDFERVAIDGYPFPGVLPGTLFDQRLLVDDRLVLEVGYEHDEPVTIGALYVAHGLAHLMLGVTLPEARHRGYWSAMARSRIVEAGGRPAAGLFSDMSRPGAEKLGFLPISRFTLWSRNRSTTG